MSEALLSRIRALGFLENFKISNAFVTKGLYPELNYSSKIDFVTIECVKGGTVCNIDVVVKTQLVDEDDREIRDCDQMFENEAVMYTLILPKIEADKCELFPKVFLAVATGGRDVSKDIVILENLYSNGFLNKSDIYMDFSHISVAICKLAKFHSLSYISKMRNNDFLNKITNLKETWYREDIPKNVKSQNMTAIKRGIQPLIERGYQKKILMDFLNSLQDLFKVVEELKKPSEPFGVVCHGDFIRNNIVFKYEKEVPVDMRMFDIQNSIYGTPVLDLATFLYRSTNKEVRSYHWDTFLNIYWNEFVANLPRDLNHPSQEKFMEHFAEKAVYAYIPCSFCVPMMLRDNMVRMEDYSGRSEEERNQMFMESGGEQGTSAVVDIVLHMLDKFYIQTFLKKNTS